MTIQTLWGRPGRGGASLLAALVLALVIYALAFTGTRSLWEPDEGRYTASALQMLESGDWWIPHLHPEIPHLAKPPMTYWLIASSLALFGRSELAVRLPGTLAFVLTTLLVALIARRLDRGNALLSAATFATSMVPYAAATTVTTDVFLTLWETLAALGFVIACCGPEAGRSRHGVVLMWLGFGLAFLTKGPPGLLPLAAFVAFLALTRGWASTRSLLSGPGLALFVVVGLGWYVSVVTAEPSRLSYFVGNELIGRIATGIHHRSPGWLGAFRVYLPSLLIGGLPWILFTGPALRRAGQLLHPAAWRRWRRDDPAQALLLLWILIPLSVFFVAQSRMPLYVVPLFIPFALLVTPLVERRLTSRRARVVAVAASMVALATVRGIASFASTGKDVRPLAADLQSRLAGPIREVVFVNERNLYGLAFYLDADVEHVAMTQEQLSGPTSDRRETVSDELQDHHGSRLFLVPHRLASDLAITAGALGGDWLPLGEIRGYATYWFPDLRPGGHGATGGGPGGDRGSAAQAPAPVAAPVVPPVSPAAWHTARSRPVAGATGPPHGAVSAHSAAPPSPAADEPHMRALQGS